MAVETPGGKKKNMREEDGRRRETVSVWRVVGKSIEHEDTLRNGVNILD